MSSGNTGSIYKYLRRLGNCPGRQVAKSINIESHKQLNLSACQSAERIASFFSDISNEYNPLNIQTLPPQLKDYIFNDTQKGPVLSEYQVYLAIKQAKKPNSSVKGDIHPKLVKRFDVELTTPACI